MKNCELIIRHADRNVVEVEIKRRFTRDKNGCLFFGLQDGMKTFGFDYGILKYDDICSKWNWLLLQASYQRDTENFIYWSKLKEFAQIIEPDERHQFPTCKYLMSVGLDDSSIGIFYRFIDGENTCSSIEDIFDFLGADSYIRCENTELLI